MRVLHIVSNISLRSGIMSFIMNYGRHLSESVKFDFLYYEEREFDHKTEIASLGGRVYKSPSPTSVRAFHSYIKHFCEQHHAEYSVIHLHDPFLILFYSSLKKRLGAKSFVVHAHSTKFSDNMFGELRNRVFSFPNNWLPDQYFACSRIAGERIFGRKFYAKGNVINNAISVDKYCSDPDKRRMKREEIGVADRFVVGHVGNFTKPKNHEFIISVFAKVVKIHPNAVLLLVGDGEDRYKIEKECVSLGIANNVRFFGVRNDVNDIICTFDRFLFPSLYEGLGIALIEAQTAGVPCIYSTSVPTETNILKENNAIIDLNRSYDEWVNAILNDKFTVKFDSKQRIIDAGFDIETEAVKLKNLYRELTGDKDETV